MTKNDRVPVLTEGIGKCVEVILTEQASEEVIGYAEEGLKLFLNNAMQSLRGEESASENVGIAVELSEKATKELPNSFVYEMSNKLAMQCNLSFEHARMLILPYVCEVLDAEYIEERIIRLQNIILPGSTSRVELCKQLEFIIRILKLEIPEFIGEQEMQGLVDGLELHDVMSKEKCFAIYLSAFRMERTEDGNYVMKSEYKEIVERQAFVNGLQQLTLETLLLTQEFLNEHNLTFYLGEGTLLGAIRHHGFIPWDDDIDILMPRDDYEKLVQLEKEGKVPSTLNFDALENNDKHWVLGAKMQLVRKTPYIQKKVMKLSKCCGPYVDIFPLDYWPEQFSVKQAIAAFHVRVCRRLLFMKTGYSKGTKKKLARMVLRVMCLFLKNRWIENHAIKNMKKFDSARRKYLVNLCSYYPFYKEVWHTACFGKPRMIPFEGHSFPVPEDYDFVLKTIYGCKYDSIPPYKVINMRKHAFEYINE